MTLWKLYKIVRCNPLIKNQDVNTRYFGSYPPFWMILKMTAVEKYKMPIKHNISLFLSFTLTFMSRTSIFKTLNFISDIKARKKVKIRNQNNKVSHLMQDTTWESDKNTRRHHTQESQEASPFPAGDHKAAMNRQDSTTDTKHK